jgi:hypothetical protein
MVTQQTKITLVACVVLREHLTAVPTFLVLLNRTSYTCWDFFDVHDLLRTSFQQLDEKVAARNGGKGVPSIIQSGKEKPSDDALTLGTNKTTNSPASGNDDDRIGNSIQLLGESNIRVAHIESNAAEKNTLRNLLFNLQTQKRQMVVERLKAIPVFDNPLAESLGEQIEEIEVEIEEYTSKLDSIMGAEMTAPPHKNLTPPHN